MDDQIGKFGKTGLELQRWQEQLMRQQKAQDAREENLREAARALIEREKKAGVYREPDIELLPEEEQPHAKRPGFLNALRGMINKKSEPQIQMKKRQYGPAEEEFLEYLIKIGEEYINTKVERYMKDKNNICKANLRKKAVFMAKALGGLAAYADMDNHTELTGEIQQIIMETAKKKCENYAYESYSKDENEGNRLAESMKRQKEFFDLFLEAFIDHRFDNRIWKRITNIGQEAIKDAFLKCNHKENTTTERHGLLGKQEVITRTVEYFCEKKFIIPQIILENPILIASGLLRIETVDAPTVKQILEENDTYCNLTQGNTGR